MVLISGIAVVDLIASGLERVAGAGELVFGSVRASLGGHACNVSVDLVQLGFPKSRLRAVFPTGRDMFGDYLVRSLRRKGVRVEPFISGKAPTSLDLILVARGQDRRYHADPGANIVMPAGPVLELLERHRPLVFYAGGAGLLNRMDARLATVLRTAKKLGALTYVDVVSPYRQTWDFLRRALPWTDFFHCNTDEAAAIVGTRDPDSAARGILRLGAGRVFLTMGDRGLLAAMPSATFRVPAFEVRTVDPTGAGDAFSSGLIFKAWKSLAGGDGPDEWTEEDWIKALVYASACGAVCCQGVGTTTSVSAPRLAALLRRQARKVQAGIQSS